MSALDHDCMNIDTKVLTDGTTSQNERTFRVITHHAPSPKGMLSPRHENNPWRYTSEQEQIYSNLISTGTEAVVGLSPSLGV